MEQVRLGGTGLEVFRIRTGCRSYGDPARNGCPSALPEAQARALLARALELGIKFDPADVSCAGISAQEVGRTLLEEPYRPSEVAGLA